MKETDRYLLTNSLFIKSMKVEDTVKTLSTNPNTIDKILSDRDNNFQNIVRQTKCSDYAKTKLTDLFSLIITEKDNEALDYNLLHTKIVDYEKKILDDKVLTDHDKKLLLMSTSIGRYSLHYWYTNAQLQNARIERKWWEWLLVGAADVAGGVAGAEFGVAGAVAGAVGASSGMATLLEWAQG